jgi:hypothetical protein
MTDLRAPFNTDVVHCFECRYASMTGDGECKYCGFWQEDGGEALYLDGNFYCAAGILSDKAADNRNASWIEWLKIVGDGSWRTPEVRL